MNALKAQPDLSRPTELPPDQLARLFLDPTWGLHCAAQDPNLQELCQALGGQFQALALRQPVLGLAGLLPLLMHDCEQDLRRQHATETDQRVLLAAKLLWAAAGPRSRRVAVKAWGRVWGWDAGAMGMVL